LENKSWKRERELQKGSKTEDRGYLSIKSKVIYIKKRRKREQVIFFFEQELDSLYAA